MIIRRDRYMRELITFLLLVMVSCVFHGCRTTEFLESSTYRGDGGQVFVFNQDYTFDYRVRMEGGYIYELGRGTWTPNGKELLLHNSVLNTKELPIITRVSPFKESQCELVINLLPRQHEAFSHLPKVWDIVNVELIIGEKVFSIEAETTTQHLTSLTDSLYFRMFPKSGIDHQSELLNDTLYSRHISLKEIEGKLLTVDVNCDPALLAQVKKEYGNIRIINDRRIKWNNVLLERPR